MSFERQSAFGPETATPIAVPEEEIQGSQELIAEEVDLESSEGRSVLIQEIENLALTCDVADNPDMFAQSEVFHLVESLQLTLTDIESEQSLGQPVGDEQASTVQRLYDELAVEVEQPSVINVYVGPQRKDMVLEDLSDEGSLEIDFHTPEPELDRVVDESPKFIHNTLPDRQNKIKAPVSDGSIDPDKIPETLYKSDSPEVALDKEIKKIEGVEMSFFDTWISDYQSPYEALGEMMFGDLQAMASSPVNSRDYVEFKSLLEQERVKYEVFNQWSQLFDDMQVVVDRAKYKPFKQVIEEYLTITEAG